MKNSPMLAAAIGIITTAMAAAPLTGLADSDTVLELYVDSKTQQIYAEPGPGRVRLGRFQLVDETAGTESALEQRIVERQQAYEAKMEQAIARAGATGGASVNVGRKGLEVVNADGEHSLNLGGRIHADASTHNGDDNLINRGSLAPLEATAGSEIRRARLALKGTLYSDYKYHLEGDWAGDKVSLKDVMVTYTGIDPLEITVGNQKHAMSMEIQESSNDIMFNERSLLSALTAPAFDRAMGINLKSKGDDWSLQGGIYGDAISSSGDGADEGSGWSVRGTFAPVNSGDSVVHLGANLGQRKANDNNTLVNSKSPRFRYETTHISDLYLSDTGAIAGFDDITLAVFEGAIMSGPFSLQGEYGSASVSREHRGDLDFDAWYLQAAWTLTGEVRRYKGSDGEFKGLVPAHNFDPAEGFWGAWELALRFDQLDLVDGGILGGEQDRATLNLNWYLNPNLRILMGYSRSFDVSDSPVLTAGGDQPDNLDVFNVRTQWAF